jgi:hypothetical protein
VTVDVRINVGLPAHPKTKKLIKRLGTDAAWRLVCLFAWVAANRTDGDLSGLSVEDVELCVDWPGDEGAFVKALVEVGFIDGDDGAFRMHDWEEHNPWAFGSDARSEKARWLATVKHHGKEEAARVMPEYASRMAGKKPAEGNPATSMRAAVLDSATSMRVAESSSAPLPLPLPLPLPSPSPSLSATPLASQEPKDPPSKPNRARETHPPITLAPRGSSAKRLPLADHRPPAPGKDVPPLPGTAEKNFSKSGTLAEAALAETIGVARRGGP